MVSKTQLIENKCGKSECGMCMLRKILEKDGNIKNAETFVIISVSFRLSTDIDTR